MFSKSKTRTLMLNILSILTISFFIIACAGKGFNSEGINPPVADKIPKELALHDHNRTDNYYWLNERDNPEVLAYLEAENKYRDNVLAPTLDLQNKIFDEIKGRIKQDDSSVPYLDNGFYYYHRYEAGSEYPLHLRKKGSLDAPDEVLLNIPELAEGFTYFSVGDLSVSEDNKMLAYSVDTLSRRKYDIYFKNLDTGKLLPYNLSNTSGYVVWANDNKTVFYCVKDSTLRVYKVMKHIIGTDPLEDEEIFYEKDNTFSVSLKKSNSDKYIFITSSHTLSTEVRIIDADNPGNGQEIFQKREKDLEYDVSHTNGRFYIYTNLEAENFRLMETPVNRTGKKYWKEVVPNRDNVMLNNISAFKDFIVLGERKDAVRQLHVMDLKNETDHYISFDEDVYMAYPKENYVFDTPVLRYLYTSLSTPNSTFDYNMTTKEKVLLKVDEVGGGFNSNDYKTERLWAVAGDDTRVPVSIVYKKGMKKDGQNPLLLKGYGSYGSSSDPYFSIPVLSLLDRGFIYGIAHIRGGSEMGRKWYKDGKLLNKKNTFTDFIDCAKYLIDEQYTNPDKLFATGGSAGGLLIGAVINMEPDLFNGVVAAVPWVDVVTTMLDESIPLTTSEFDEWGNPIDKTYYDYMLSYSPYDNVEAKNYPAMLVTTGLHDSQVQYFEPAKWVAKLRDMKTDNNVLILDTDMDSGHGGASGRFRKYKRTAQNYSFFITLNEY